MCRQGGWQSVVFTREVAHWSDGDWSLVSALLQCEVLTRLPAVCFVFWKLTIKKGLGIFSAAFLLGYSLSTRRKQLSTCQFHESSWHTGARQDFCSSANILCFRYKYSITGVNLIVRIVTRVPQVFIHGALRRLNSKGIKCNSIPKHEIFAIGTKCIGQSFHEIPVPYWEGRLSKGSRSDSIFILEQMVKRVLSGWDNTLLSVSYVF